MIGFCWRWSSVGNNIVIFSVFTPHFEISHIHPDYISQLRVMKYDLHVKCTCSVHAVINIKFCYLIYAI